ncbi:MAG TPA: hypothetical protein VN605_09325 [Thermoanaerobaculia bacterium]|nr:hypothetical protein [Thermoanaerobaculia bacterium]
MADTAEQKVHIERAIERARDGVSERIDELDAKLRHQLDIKTIARQHAPELIAGGAVVGFLVGFGLPKILKRVIQIGIPLALVAYKIKQSRDGNALGYSEM